MQVHDMTEQAYKNGYDKGYADGKKDVDVEKALAWLQGYTTTDTEQVYSNGCVFVPLYRVKQAFEDKAYNGFCVGG